MSVATSAVGISNYALSLIQKAGRITSMTDGSAEANLCNKLFDEAVDDLLTMHPWNFAMTRAELAQSATAPDFGYDYKYQLPTDPYCLRVVNVLNENGYEITDYEIEGRYLLADEEVVKIRYVGRTTNYGQFPATFRTALAYYLASQLAVPLVNNTRLTNDMMVKFNLIFRKAITIDAKQGKKFENDDTKYSWDTARYLG